MILVQCPQEEFSLYRSQIIRPKPEEFFFSFLFFFLFGKNSFFPSIHHRNHRRSRKQIEIYKVVEWGLESLKGKSLKASSSKLACIMHIALVRLISCCLILFFIF